MIGAMHQQVAQGVPEPGTIDVWDFDLLEVGGRIEVSHVRTFLYYLASPSTAVVFCSSVSSAHRSVTLKAYGPVCEDGKPLYVEMTISSSDQLKLKDNNIARLASEEILLFRDKIKEHVKGTHPLFSSNSTCNPQRVCGALGLPFKS